MASLAAAPDPAPAAPPAEPSAIRAALTSTLAAVFDQEWSIVLDRAKETKELGGIYALLNKWQHIVVTELRNPGSYFRLQAKAEQIIRTGENPGAATIEEMRALIERRQVG